MNRLYVSNASTTLATAVNAVDDPVTFDVALGTGSLFPQPTPGASVFPCTLEKAGGVIEQIDVTNRVGDTFTATRAQDGSSINSFSIGDRCELRWRASEANLYIQEQSPINMGNNALSGALADSSCEWNGGAMKAGVYQATDGGSVNAITVPAGGGEPHIDGDPIVTRTEIGLGSPEALALYDQIYFRGVVIFVNDGTDPNQQKPVGSSAIWQQLSDALTRFIMGGTAPGIEAESGKETSPAGDHSHAGETLGHNLSIDELPPHQHGIGGNPDRFYVRGGRGIPTESPGSIGITIAPTQTNPIGEGFAHSHGLVIEGPHTHTTSHRPAGYRLVPWVRVS